MTKLGQPFAELKNFGTVVFGERRNVFGRLGVRRNKEPCTHIFHLLKRADVSGDIVYVGNPVFIQRLLRAKTIR